MCFRGILICYFMKAHTAFKWLLLALWFVLLSFGSVAKGQNDPFLTYKIKHLGNFASYTTWPNEADGVFVIGVVESREAFLAIQQHYKGQRIKDKPVEVRLFPADHHSFDCNLLYLPKSVANTGRILAQIQTKPILSVCDGATERGAQINFVVMDTELAYELNPLAYNKAQLEVDYFFLKTSRIVK